MTPLQPKFTITNRMTAAITLIERARGFLEAARLSDDWVLQRDLNNLIELNLIRLKGSARQSNYELAK